MNYWILSDTHFNHTKLQDWGGRTGDWQQKMWDGITAIPAGDILLHLGDICIGNDQEIHADLRTNASCDLILVRGNHDKKSASWYYDHGWDFVCDGFELIFQGHYLHFTHRPARVNNHTSWNIHGHTHGNMHRAEEYNDFYDKNYHIDVSPELVGFAPIKLETILKGKK